MSEPYVYYVGDPDCPHDDVSISTLTVIPPITEWKCNNRQCRRTIRQTNDLAGTVAMPEVKQQFDPNKYSYAHMRLEGDTLYRSDYLHGEDEEMPEEFQATDELARAFKGHDWYRALSEVRVDLRYDLQSGSVDLIGVEGIMLETPVKML